MTQYADIVGCRLTYHRQGVGEPMLPVHGIYPQDKVTGVLMAMFHMPMHTFEGRKTLLHFARCLDYHA